MSGSVEVLRAGPLTTVQDHGRFGHRDIGVSPSGAADLRALARANALVGNDPAAACLEVTFGGLSIRAGAPTLCAITGAECPGGPVESVLELTTGDVLSLDGARRGIRTYVAFAGGIDVAPVLGSRSTDTLSGLGPAPLRAGDVLAIGTASPRRDAPALAEAPPLPAGGADLAIVHGPRSDWLDEHAWAALCESSWEVSSDSNRVAVRLGGAPLKVRAASLAPEPLVRGAVQVPPDGRPILFLADHPVTGGYPVVAVLTPLACDLLAQCRPGMVVRLVSADLDDDRAALATG